MKMLTPCFIFLITFIVRTYKIEKGNFVVWDEAHFGKFASKYLTRTFYFDVHPPLGKMLTALGGYIFNQPTDFSFASASEYPKNFDFAGMRRFHALISSLTPVFSYLILKELRYNFTQRFLLCMMFIFENGFTSIGRLILLDSHLLTATSAVIYCLTRVFKRNFQNTDLFFLGICLGLVLSIKWIGCFTTALVGIFIIYTLWRLINSKMPISHVFLIFVKFSLFLIILPISIYIGIYYIHFSIVNKTSTDEGHMSSFFQASLEGNSHKKNRKYIAYATRITLKNACLSGGYLHSHPHMYPGKSMNQVTTYSHKDNNNNWAFQKVSESNTEPLFVTDEDKVVIYHLETARYINVSKTQSYLSQGLLTGATTIPLTNDNVFIIETYSDTHAKKKRIKSLTTKFRLKHFTTGLYLKSTNKKYPDWGFSQGEVVCTEDMDEGTLWTVEENISDKVTTDINPLYEEIYNKLFFKNFIEHNILQYNVNKSFVQDENLEPDAIVSKPYEWPILRRGLRMCSWDEKSMKFYMFGNPLLWFSSTLSLFVAPIIFITKYINFKRGAKKFRNRHNEAYEVFICVGGWLLHYLPFFAVGRVLYFHHYYPALFFAIMSLCYVLRHLSINFVRVYIFYIIGFYAIFSPLTYGFIDSRSLKFLKFIPSWNFID